MQRLVLLSLLIMMAGCESTQRIDRATLDQRYEETQLAEGVLSSVPIRVDPNQPPPVVVSWLYAGTTDDGHTVVFRLLTWDSKGNPTGEEQRYRIAQNALEIQQPFAYTSDDRRWLPLHLVADAIEPPTDLPAARKAPSPIEQDPTKRLDTEILPPMID